MKLLKPVNDTYDVIQGIFKERKVVEFKHGQLLITTIEQQLLLCVYIQ